MASRGVRMLSKHSKISGLVKELKRDMIEQTEVLERSNLRHFGTNLILQEFGMSNYDVNRAVEFYGKEIVKATSRIARDYKPPKDPTKDLPYLFQAVYLLGESDVRALIRMGKDITELLTEFDMYNVNGFKILTPAKVKIPLEVIASSTNVPEILKPIGLSSTYRGEKTVIFEYAQR